MKLGTRSWSKRNGAGHDCFTQIASNHVNGFHRRTIKGVGRITLPRYNGRNERQVTALISEHLEVDLANAMKRRLPKSSIMTVGELLQNWFDNVVEWSPKNRQINTWRWRRHVITDKDFWETPLTECNVHVANAFLQRINGSDDTRLKVKAIVQGGFTYAVAQYGAICPDNPFLRLTGKQVPKKSKSRMQAIPGEHQALWVEAAISGRLPLIWSALVLFMFDAGAEPQEFLGLQYGDIDWGNATVHLRRTADQIGSEVIVKSIMKASKRDRKIRVGPSTLAALRALLEPGMGLESHVFSRDGLPWGYLRFYSAWRDMAKAYELPYHPPLEFRHSMASALLSSGRPLTAVSARLGHENFSTTLQHYAHALPNDVDALGDHSVSWFAAMLTDLKRPKATEIDDKSGAKVVQQHERLAGRRIA